MPRIYFKNNTNWKKVYCNLIAKDHTKKVLLDNNNLSIDVSEEYEYVVFHNGRRGKTHKYLVGKKDLGIENSYNSQLRKNVTYIFNPNPSNIGHVDTYELEDNINLAYRGGKKIINVFVPANYDKNKKYGLLYFYDSQNLFRNNPAYTTKNDPYGGWQLDEVLSIYDKDIIVVGIENADDHRMNELTYKIDDKKYNLNDIDYGNLYESKLDKLLNFMHNTVHPFIKEKYSIDEENIGVGGASCGGIAAYLTCLSYPEIYKYSLVYSPAFLFYSEEYYRDFLKTLKIKKLPRIHIYSGCNDPLEEQIYKTTLPMKKLMVELGYPEELIKETYIKEYMHNEIAWRLVLPTSFDFLLD